MTDSAAELFTDTRARQRALELAITEHVLGWRWYELTDQTYGRVGEDPKRAGSAMPEPGTRFVADPVWAEGGIKRGSLIQARPGSPISRTAADHATGVTRNPLIAFGALLEAMHEWRLEADGFGFAARCTRGLGFGDGRTDGPDLPIVICEALAQALRLKLP